MIFWWLFFWASVILVNYMFVKLLKAPLSFLPVFGCLEKIIACAVILIFNGGAISILIAGCKMLHN